MWRAESALLPGVIRLKWLWVGSGIFVTIAALVMVFLWAKWSREKETITAIMLEDGFLEIVPPSTFGGPGTINTIELLKNGRVEMHPTCDVDPGFLANRIQKSDTIERELKQSLEEKLDVSAQVREKLTAAAGINEINSIHLKLNKPHILLISDETLNFARNALLKNECEDAVIENISNGGIVCQTLSVIQADVVYEIKYDNTVKMDERAKLTSDVAAKLNLDADQNADDRISGSQLFFGVKLAPNAIISGSKPGVTKCLLKR